MRAFICVFILSLTLSFVCCFSLSLFNFVLCLELCFVFLCCGWHAWYILWFLDRHCLGYRVYMKFDDDNTTLLRAYNIVTRSRSACGDTPIDALACSSRYTWQKKRRLQALDYICAYVTMWVVAFLCQLPASPAKSPSRIRAHYSL
jgi:hypothetical protein